MENFKAAGSDYKVGLTLLSPYILPITRIEANGNKTKLYFHKRMTRKAIIAAFQENDKAIKHYHN